MGIATDIGNSEVSDEEIQISVIIPVYNGLPFLVDCVDSVSKAAVAHGSVEIIIVDNCSTDSSTDTLTRLFGEIGKIETGIPGNVGAVRNHGASLAKGVFLSFIDSDCLIPIDYFSRAQSAIKERKADVTGSTYELPEKPHWIEKTWFSLHRRREDGPTTYLPAGNLFVKHSAFTLLGGFDETLQSGEDTELCQRFRDRGFMVFHSRDVQAVHLGNPKSLKEFFLKQLWHAKGQLGTFRNDWKDLPLLATIFHLLAIVTGAVLTFLSPNPTTTFFSILLPSFLIVPIAAVLFRMAKAKSFCEPFRPVFLYLIYFTARTVALARLFSPGTKSPALPSSAKADRAPHLPTQ